MGRSGKYNVWEKHLKALPERVERHNMTFDELESLCEEPLPLSARRHRPWWANQRKAGHSQAESWMSAGWRTADVDLERQRLTFIRASASPTSGMLTQADKENDITLDHCLRAGFKLSAEWIEKDGQLLLVGSIPQGYGVYVFARGDALLYVGKAASDLRQRLYGYERPGRTQSTNIRLSQLIRDALSTRQKIKIYTLVCSGDCWNGLPLDVAAGVEAGLTKSGVFPWNMQRG